MQDSSRTGWPHAPLVPALALLSLGAALLAGCTSRGATARNAATLYSVGGSVWGLAGSGLVLRNNGGDDLTVFAGGTFAFASNLASGATYDVRIAAQPASPPQTCWVKNGSGTVTRGAVTTVAVLCPSPWKKVVLGYEHTVGIRPDGTLWTWGWNLHGQLGDGTTVERHAPVQVGLDADWASIAAGEFHTVAVKADGTIWTWGWNVFGLLGDGLNSPQYTPEPIP
jgi:alpha-tubulin suppressor-like RCC1 family protein